MLASALDGARMRWSDAVNIVNNIHGYIILFVALYIQRHFARYFGAKKRS